MEILIAGWLNPIFFCQFGGCQPQFPNSQETKHAMRLNHDGIAASSMQLIAGQIKACSNAS